jgi:hypothetical protein
MPAIGYFIGAGCAIRSKISTSG